MLTADGWFGLEISFFSQTQEKILLLNFDLVSDTSVVGARQCWWLQLGAGHNGSLDIGSHASYVTNATGAACTAPAPPLQHQHSTIGDPGMKMCVLLLFYHGHLKS